MMDFYEGFFIIMRFLLLLSSPSPLLTTVYLPASGKEFYATLRQCYATMNSD